MRDTEDAIIRPITTSMFEEVHDFLEAHFFPEAPLSASLGMSQRTQFWTWAWVRSCLMEEESMAALDPDTGRVIGVIIGKTSYLLDMSVFERTVDFFFGGGWEEWLGELIWRLCWWLRWILPKYYVNATKQIFSDIFQRLGYEEQQIMTELGTSRLWVVTIICVDKTLRNKGIASKLVEAATSSASKHNCDSSAVIVSNKYSERIFVNNKYEKRSSIAIASVTDKKGEAVFNKTGEHENITLMTRKYNHEKRSS